MIDFLLQIDTRLYLELALFILLCLLWFMIYKYDCFNVIIKRQYKETVNQNLIKENEYLKDRVKSLAREKYEIIKEYERLYKELKDSYENKLQSVFDGQNKYKEQ